MMSELRFLRSAVVAAVADREGVPLLVAQDLAARAALSAALRAERLERERSDRRKQWLAVTEELLREDGDREHCT
jgi:hypothetical protein